MFALQLAFLSSNDKFLAIVNGKKMSMSNLVSICVCEVINLVSVWEKLDLSALSDCIQF